MKIGFSISTLDNPFFLGLVEGCKKEASRIGVELIILDAEDDISNQIEDILELKMDGEVDALIVNPCNNPAGLKEVLDEVDVPIIAVDRSINSDKVVSYISSDNLDGGRIAGEYIAEKINYKGNVIHLAGFLTTSSGYERKRGFSEIVDGYEDMKLLDGIEVGNSREPAYLAMLELLDRYPDIDAIFCNNDEVAIGAFDAMRKVDSGKEIVIVGFDGTAMGIEAVRKGDFSATIGQQVFFMGMKSIDAARNAALGKPIEENIIIPVKLIVA